MSELTRLMDSFDQTNGGPGLGGVISNTSATALQNLLFNNSLQNRLPTNSGQSPSARAVGGNSISQSSLNWQPAAQLQATGT